MTKLKSYEPVVLQLVGDSTEGYSALVHDKRHNYPDVWIDLWISDGELMVDWNMWIFHDWDKYEMRVKRFQKEALENDGWLWCLISECVEGFLIRSHRLIAHDDGTYELC